MDEYVMEVELSAETEEDANREADDLLVIPRQAVADLLTLIDGAMPDGHDSYAGPIEAFREWVD